jgi:F0F1-type ATP synthase membrane subunit b/b'
MDIGMLLIKAVVAGMVFVAIGGFFIWKFSKDTIDKDLNRLNKETEAVRGKQIELNTKIKEASEELAKRKAEADALVAKMTEDASTKAKEERDKIVAKARIEGEEIIVKANNTKEEIRKAIVKDMDMKTIDVTALVLEEVL